MCISVKGAVMALQEGRGHVEEAFRTCYQPFGNQGAGARFREVLFHLNGEYQLPVSVAVRETFVCGSRTLYCG
jgi:hypothetical protein